MYRAAICKLDSSIGPQDQCRNRNNCGNALLATIALSSNAQPACAILRYLKVGATASYFLSGCLQVASRGFRGRACGAAGARWVNGPVRADAPAYVWSTIAAASEVEAPIFLRHMSRAPPWLVASKRPPRWCMRGNASGRRVATEVCVTSFDTHLTLAMRSAPLCLRPHLTISTPVIRR